MSPCIIVFLFSEFSADELLELSPSLLLFVLDAFLSSDSGTDSVFVSVSALSVASVSDEVVEEAED